jgi:hypothetical protein
MKWSEWEQGGYAWGLEPTDRRKHIGPQPIAPIDGRLVPDRQPSVQNFHVLTYD